MELIMAKTGESVPLGKHVQAVVGPYAGTWWRIDDVLKHDDGGHRIAASRSHTLGRHRVIVSPHVFGLLVREAVKFVRRLWNTLCLACTQIEVGIIMGALALIPLAFFEQYHGAEHVTAIVHYLMGGER